MIVILIIALVIILIVWLNDKNRLKKIIQQLTFDLLKQKSSLTDLETKVKGLRDKNEALSRYEGILDAERMAEEILLGAEQKAASLIADATNEFEAAKKEAKDVRTKAQRESAELKASMEKLISHATEESKRMIAEARKRAEDVAGSAFTAMEKADHFERTVKAMRNIIEGYGDQYLIPTYSLLDDLAQEFGHTEAGEKLLLAREKSRIIIKNGSAATCDYVESNRRETAINFVLDAFNGKVDSILSKIKRDNFGVLQQKIEDAFQVVNSHGRAFRNAQITDEYLAARLGELKWAVVVQELKILEQEEQRRIKERIREEEKARREYERAIKEAAKEEEVLKKLIEKAHREVSQASEEQKAMYEEKLMELEAKLKTAEEKNQRAMSMAQQTRSGNVYIISNVGSFGDDVFKIGMTRRLEPLDRIRELGDASVPFEFDVHAMIYSDDAPELEKKLHKIFLRMQLNKVNARKEFFKVTLSDIRREVEAMAISVKWTMTAEAKQYRESLAIEEAIKNDQQRQLQWEKSQLEQVESAEEVEEAGVI